MDLSKTPDTLEHARELLAMLRALRTRPGLAPSELLKLADTEARNLALQHRLEKERELQEDRIVRQHPMWARIRRTIVKALEKHPAAARLVTAELEAIDT